MNKLTRLKLINIISHKETEYVFRNGQAIIVVGDNQDNPSQQGNGAGKSGIIEGISIGLTGECIRAASMKELVCRNGSQDYGTIELDFHNTMYRNEVNIIRHISRNKAMVIELFINGEQQVYSDVNEYNKQILQLIGITKDDLFDFFLITKEHYKPFLTVGDTVKKAIINRFSGADKIDETSTFIDQDVNEKNNIIKAIEAQINSIKGKQDYVSDQIKAEEEKYSEEAVQAKRVELENTLAIREDKVEGGKVLIQDYELELYLARQKEKDFKVDQYDKQIEELEAKKNAIEQKTSINRLVIQDIRNTYTEEINDQKELSKALKDSIKENKQAERDALSMQHSIHNYTVGLIECPKCQHQFTLKDEDGCSTSEWDEYTSEELSEKIVAIKDCIEQIQQENISYDQELQATSKRLEEIEEEIFTKAEETKIEIVRLELEYNQVSTKQQQFKKLNRELVTQFEGIKDNILDIEAKLYRVQREQNALEYEVDQLQAQLDQPSEESQLLDKLNDQLLQYIDDETEYQDKLEKAVADKQAIEEWYTNFKNFKSHLANQSIKNIQDYTNMYLQQMGTDLSIGIEGYRMMSNKKLKEQITTVVLRNGFEEGSYGTFSGGERGRIDVCVILAMQTLINLNCTSGGLDLMLADEIFDSIDALGLECIINGLQSTRRTIMIVSQVQINSLADYTLLIRKQNKISFICQQSTLELIQGNKGQSSQSTVKQELSKKELPQSSEKVKVVSTTKKRSKNSSGTLKN